MREMFSPLPERLWNRTTAAHLLNRAGFGGTPREIDALVSLGLNKAVASLTNPDEDDDLYPLPHLVDPATRMVFKRRMKDATDAFARREVQRELQQADNRSITDLRVWWLNRLRYTCAPLREKMTLFWHSHFATSNQKVNFPWLMMSQNSLLRRNALGDFPAILKEISRDPAMIRWLDLEQSRREHPNENFAREVMELFSLGEGHYSEKDIQEASRAFTGYRVNQENGAFRFLPREYDSSEKTFFCRTGPFTGDQIIDMICERPECARFLARKLWTFFVTTDPSRENISELAVLLQSNHYRIAPTLSTLFQSAVFYSPRVIAHQIKGPVQWMIQTTRMLEIPLPDARVLESSLGALGQILFAPPNVKGWDGGRAWISASSLLYRYNLAAYLLSGKARILGGGKSSVAVIPLEKIAPLSVRNDPDALLDTIAFRVFNRTLSTKERAQFLSFLSSKPRPFTDTVIRDFLQVMMSTPEYQLT
jgi:hypothetical protein